MHAKWTALVLCSFDFRLFISICAKGSGAYSNISYSRSFETVDLNLTLLINFETECPLKYNDFLIFTNLNPCLDLLQVQLSSGGQVQYVRIPNSALQQQQGSATTATGLSQIILQQQLQQQQNAQQTQESSPTQQTSGEHTVN